jgi:hypothetical protein
MSKEKQERRTQDQQDRKLSKELDKELDMSFPASDPPASTQPGSGVTGPEVAEPAPAKAK